MSKSVEAIKALEMPSTAEAEAVRSYLLAQASKDFSDAKKCFADGVVFNDLMYPVSGKEEVIKSLAEYAKEYLTTFVVEAVHEAGSPDRYLALCAIALRGVEETTSTCELISLKDGKIVRVDNCFDVDKLKRLYW